MSPSRPLQSVLDEKSAKCALFASSSSCLTCISLTAYLLFSYLQERRLASLRRSAEDGAAVAPAHSHALSTGAGPNHNISTEATGIKRNADAASDATGEDAPPAKKRGRPKGSKNKVKAVRD